MINNNKNSWLQNLHELIKNRLNTFDHTKDGIGAGNNTTLKSKLLSIFETKWNQELNKEGSNRQENKLKTYCIFK